MESDNGKTKKTWVRIASGNTAASLEMYEKDYGRRGIQTKVDKDVTGRWRLSALLDNHLPDEPGR